MNQPVEHSNQGGNDSDDTLKEAPVVDAVERDEVWERLSFPFRMRPPIDQKTFIIAAICTFITKYLIDASIVYLAVQRIYPIWEVFNPLSEFRLGMTFLTPEPVLWWNENFWFLQLFFYLVFAYIGLTLALRRTVDIGASPATAIWSLVPILNVFFFAWACLKPSGSVKPARSPEVYGKELQQKQDKIEVAFTSVLVAALWGTVCLALMLSSSVGDAANIYAASLFVGMPLTVGIVSGVLYNRKVLRSFQLNMTMGVTTFLVLSAAMLLLSLEGIICILMYAPFAIPLQIVGILIGKLIAEISNKPAKNIGLLAVILPVWTGVDRQLTTEHEMQASTSVIVNAPIETVWQKVIAFSQVPPPTEVMFKAGIAYPIHAKIDGEGVGAIRHCVFSTGAFVEPITVWNAPTHLAFDVTEQPHPMFELTPYKHIHPPHLDNGMVSQRGEFRLEQLPDGRTKVTGNTWYVLNIHPVEYWGLWTQYIIHRIHKRVLNHVKEEAEEEANAANANKPNANAAIEMKSETKTAASVVTETAAKF